MVGFSGNWHLRAEIVKLQNKPNSKWVDDAYFLIGQTQFFGMDYYSSIETFQV